MFSFDFHFIYFNQALFKKLNKLRLSDLLQGNEFARMFVKKLKALAYLPKNLIRAEYDCLKRALSPALATTFRTVLEYYEREWLRVITPARFSVHGLLRRTNNVTESYNSILSDLLGSHPSPWTFIGLKFAKCLVILSFESSR